MTVWADGAERRTWNVVHPPSSSGRAQAPADSDGVPQEALAITCGAAMPVARHAFSRFVPSWARRTTCPVFARWRNWMYSQLVGW